MSRDGVSSSAISNNGEMTLQPAPCTYACNSVEHVLSVHPASSTLDFSVLFPGAVTNAQYCALGGQWLLHVCPLAPELGWGLLKGPHDVLPGHCCAPTAAHSRTYFASGLREPTPPAPASCGPWWLRPEIKLHTTQDLPSPRPFPELVGFLPFLMGPEMSRNAESPRREMVTFPGSSGFL